MAASSNSVGKPYNLGDLPLELAVEIVQKIDSYAERFEFLVAFFQSRPMTAREALKQQDRAGDRMPLGKAINTVALGALEHFNVWKGDTRLPIWQDDTDLPLDKWVKEMHAALRSRNKVVVEYLIRRKLGVVPLTLDAPFARDWFFRASRQGCGEVILKLLEEGGFDWKGVQNSEGNTFLEDAVRFGLFEAAATLLDAGADVNSLARSRMPDSKFFLDRTYFLSGLFIEAAGRTCQEVVTQFLREEFDFSERRSEDRPRLMRRAISEGKIEAVNLLLQMGINAIGDPPYTDYLKTAVRYGHIEMVREFLKRGVDINGQLDISGTPLHHAVIMGQVAMLKMLQREGANPTVKNQSGETPLDLARSRGRRDIVNAFEERAQLMAKREAHSPGFNALSMRAHLIGQLGSNTDQNPLSRYTFTALSPMSGAPSKGG